MEVRSMEYIKNENWYDEYFLLFHTNICSFSNLSSFSMSMVPGWRDAIIQWLMQWEEFKGNSIVIILAWIVRKYCGYENYIT
ncbi:MAG: hypothetical protein Ct9H90mP2_09130 [Dehalococcoidia bacterium]|nr:MAG: hypothetical protein Ct9H90mP2_09130 [Dehalococcoidia bacterium]